MENLKSESIQCPTFSGDSKDFAVWWTRFTAFAMVKRFEKVMLAGSVRHPEMPLTHAIGKALNPASTEAPVLLKIMLIKQNDLAMAYLTMAFKSP